MTEEQLFKTEEQTERTGIAEALLSAAEQIESGSVQSQSEAEERDVTIPRFEVELGRETDSETGEQRYELAWTK